ncbi:hypothetical protein BDW59DRAFT_47160 [Aspergillus cavernicola]|uniref:Pentatricopeptide repeat protein n=1 Tax=Aspergillus cavernicola TaxID=176166 RepID=A0ABR4J3E7_9EURO
MLRCSHAAAFRMQFKSSTALRAPLSSPWVGVPQRLLAIAPRLGTVHSIATDNMGATSRGYSTHPDFAQEVAQDDDASIKPIMVQTRRPFPRKGLDEDPLLRVAMNKAPISAKVVEMELTWLRDKVVMVQRVDRLLKQDNITLAAEIVREATKDKMDTTVAWNRILDYCLMKDNAKAAFKFWNDMKKRGRQPNEWAYTIMLSGLSKSNQAGINPVRTARTIYRSMQAPSSRFRPSTIHTNAMLNVCAKHGDMDTLWEIAGDLPEEGPLSPDDITYTIILNAIRSSIQRDIRVFQLDEVERAYHRRLEGVTEAKRIWTDVLYRWKKGTLELKNEMVSAMAGVLWEGNGDRHLYEVLQLINQTTGIPVLAQEPSPDLPMVSRRSFSRLKSPAEDPTEDVPFVDEQGKPFTGVEQVTHEKLDMAEEKEEKFDNIFDPVVSPDAVPYTDSNNYNSLFSPRYIPIGNRELTVILDTALMMTSATYIGKNYWQHLTRENTGYQIDPDDRSCVRYLRILRVGRSSRVTVEVFKGQIVPEGKAEGKAFHIALSTCRRDRKNPNVLKNANELLKLMDQALVMPDHRAMLGYLDLIQILQDNPQYLVSLNGLEGIQRRSTRNLGAVGRELMVDLHIAALDNLRPLVAKLEEAMSEGARGSSSYSRKRDSELGFSIKQVQPGYQVVTVLTRVRMLIDFIVHPDNERLLSKSARQAFLEESKALRKYSKLDAMEKYKGKLVYPTESQVRAYQERIASLTPPPPLESPSASEDADV